ncbi:MAG: Nif11-like leader peptide family RiPP precursor [Synergistaceae bacterium]|nr:Nif11-like leader peptide family RiPP precursor [Synergistaceae bacterium]
MSVENLKQYGKLCAENEEVRKKAKEIGLMDMNGHISHGKSLGLEFSKEDFKALAKEAGLDGENELSEEELKKVAGGYASTTAVILVVSVAAGASILGFAAAITAPKW